MMVSFAVVVAVTLPFATLPLLTIFLIRSAIFFIMPFPLFPLCPLLMAATLGNLPQQVTPCFIGMGFQAISSAIVEFGMSSLA